MYRVKNMLAGKDIVRVRVVTVVAALMLMFSSAALAQSSSGGERGQSAEATEKPGAQPPARGRLRFRNGPVCMCSQGMSEEDIRRSEEERQKRGGGRKD